MSRVLMVVSEAGPYVKTGGLGDVMDALPAALARLGEDVAVVVPRYQSVRLDSWERLLRDAPVSLGPHRFFVSVDEVIHHGVRYFFVDCPPLYDRPGIYNEGGYDYLDNHIRFGLLNQAALAIARSIFRADIFHCHDWPAAPLPLYLRTLYSGDPTFFGARCVLTIHNLGYQGVFPASGFGDLGLDSTAYSPGAIEHFGEINFLKAGVLWSDAITTVSPTYAREIQTPEYGFGLDGLLRARADRLHGILNAVDYEEWNPETDPYIATRYSADDLLGKHASKIALLEELDLPRDSGRPLIGIVSRLVEQKGFDLVGGIAGELLQQDLAMAVLGTGEPRFEQLFSDLAAARPDKFAVRFGYDPGLSHRIEAGADMFLMPSRYEPCGLSQIYSLRYGTVPIVRATGGLDDTVDHETGFKFRDYSPGALSVAMGSALEAWRDQEGWKSRMRRGMAKRYSWDASADEYRKVYQSLRAATGP